MPIGSVRFLYNQIVVALILYNYTIIGDLGFVYLLRLSVISNLFLIFELMSLYQDPNLHFFMLSMSTRVVSLLLLISIISMIILLFS
jgi:hypothetical protein